MNFLKLALSLCLMFPLLGESLPPVWAEDCSMACCCGLSEDQCKPVLACGKTFCSMQPQTSESTAALPLLNTSLTQLLILDTPLVLVNAQPVQIPQRSAWLSQRAHAPPDNLYLRYANLRL